MSLFGGGSKTTNIYTPRPAPAPPVRSTVRTEKQLKGDYARAAAGRTSYTRSMYGGGAPAPTKSYSAQLFGT